jgi:hypothetical protein
MLNSTGCATVETRRGPSSTKVVGTSSLVELGDAVEPSVEQEGSEITINVKRVCRTREMLRIQTTTTFEKYDSREPTAAKIELGAGITLGVIGGSVMAASHQLANTDAQNHGGTTGNATPYLVGGGLGLAAGVVCLIAAAVDAAQSSGTEDRVSMSTRQGGLKGIARCPATMIDLPPMQASLQFGGQTFPVGQTDLKGTLEVDLAEVLPPDTLQQASTQTAARLVVGFDGRPFVAAQPVSLEPIIFVQERKAWAALDRTACLAAASITACDAVQEFVKGYPNGAHIADARAVLDGAEPKLRVLRDAEAARVAKEKHDAEVRLAREQHEAEVRAVKERAAQEAANRKQCAANDVLWPTMSEGVLNMVQQDRVLHVVIQPSEYRCGPRMINMLIGKGWTLEDANEACRQIASGIFEAFGRHFLCHSRDVTMVRVVSPQGTVLKDVVR